MANVQRPRMTVNGWESTMVCTKDEYLEAKQARPKWHRRDYQMVADVLSDVLGETVAPINNDKSRLVSLTIVRNIEKRFADKFTEDNPRFDLEKFEEASTGAAYVMKEFASFLR